MPKLIRISSSAAVPRQALRDPGLAAQRTARNVRALGTVASVAGAAEQYFQKMDQEKTRQQERDAGLQMSRAMVRFEEQYGDRDSYGLDEIPEDIRVRRTEKIANPDGTVSEEARASVPAYEVSADVYRKFATNFAEAAASGIDDEQARAEFLQNAEVQIGQSYTQRLQRSRAEQERYTTKQLNADIAEAADAEQFEVAIQLAQDISDPEARQAVTSRLRVAQENSYYDGLMLEGVIDPHVVPDMEQAVADLRDTDKPSSLSNSQRLAKATAMEAAIRRANTAAVEEEERAKQLAVSIAWTEIGSGNPTIDEAYVQQMFDDKLIGGSERTNMLRSIANRRKEDELRVAAVADLDMLASRGYGIDPKDKQARAAVDTRFAGYVQQGMQPFDAATRIMTEYQVVPKPIASMFRSANRADAPNLQEAAQLYIQAQEIAPQALADFKENEINFIEKVAANMQLGMDTPTAVETVRAYDALSPSDKTALRQNAAELNTTNVDSLQSLISDQPSYDIPWSLFNPETPAFMQSEFNALVQKQLPTTGFNVEASRRAAFNTLTRKWRMTDVNGDYEIMKNAPQGPTEQIRQFMGTMYRDALAQRSDFYGRQFTAKDVKLRADSLTEMQIRAGQNPTYMAYVVTDPETQTIERLDRFEWNPQQAAEMRRTKILKDAQKSRVGALEQADKIKRGEIGSPYL